MFSVYQNKQDPANRSLYAELSGSFGKTLVRMGSGERENSNERRRQITLHSFRRFVKTTISDLEYTDYSEYFIGNSRFPPIRVKRNPKRQKYFRK